MTDWIGLGFFILLLIGAAAGLRALARPRPRTEEQFERNAADNPTMMGIGVAALNELMNPEAAKAKEVITQMKDGRYQKKRREGKASDSEKEE